jgi:hypothetical protein
MEDGYGKSNIKKTIKIFLVLVVLGFGFTARELKADLITFIFSAQVTSSTGTNVLTGGEVLRYSLPFHYTTDLS